MTPQKQLNRHDPKNGIWGDCYRTAIACVLDLAPADVPHFCEGGAHSLDVDRHVQTWLRERGLCLIQVPYPGETSLEDIQRTQFTANPGVHYLLSGRSKIGSNHVVVCKDGEIVHDPSLDDTGIVGPDDAGLYWIMFIGKAV